MTNESPPCSACRGDGLADNPFHPLSATCDKCKGTGKAYPLRVYASGGSTKYHDWLMSDGTIRTMSCDEAAEINRNK